MADVAMVKETKITNVDPMLDAIQVPIIDSLDRCGLWQDIARELLRIGWLIEALRPPPELRHHIHASATLCRDAALSECERSDKLFVVYKAHAEHAISQLEAQRDQINEVITG